MIVYLCFDQSELVNPLANEKFSFKLELCCLAYFSMRKKINKDDLINFLFKCQFVEQIHATKASIYSINLFSKKPLMQ